MGSEVFGILFVPQIPVMYHGGLCLWQRRPVSGRTKSSLCWVQGGWAKSTKPRDTRLDRTVAIKICTGRITERFEREARAISSLNHPHICALYDIGREGSVEFLVMEYIEGESLEARLRKGPLPLEEALPHRHPDRRRPRRRAPQGSRPPRPQARQRHAHPQRRQAARLRPGQDGRRQWSRIRDGTPRPHRRARSPRKGTILGTFQYMSPEQLEGKETDARSDIFSFGAMLYEMITGRKGFEGSSQASLIAAVMSTNPPPVSTIQPMASPALDRVVRKCLAKSPDDRWQSAGDLLSELEWIADSGSSAGIPAPVAAKRRSRERMCVAGGWPRCGSAPRVGGLGRDPSAQ